MKEWKFKKKRQELINMVKSALEKKVSPNMATDLVDACIVAVWDNYRVSKDFEKETKKKIYNKIMKKVILSDMQRDSIEKICFEGEKER